MTQTWLRIFEMYVTTQAEIPKSTKYLKLYYVSKAPLHQELQIILAYDLVLYGFSPFGWPVRKNYIRAKFTDTHIVLM